MQKSNLKMGRQKFQLLMICFVSSLNIIVCYLQSNPGFYTTKTRLASAPINKFGSDNKWHFKEK